MDSQSVLAARRPSENGKCRRLSSYGLIDVCISSDCMIIPVFCFAKRSMKCAPAWQCIDCTYPITGKSTGLQPRPPGLQNLTCRYTPLAAARDCINLRHLFQGQGYPGGVSLFLCPVQDSNPSECNGSVNHCQTSAGRRLLFNAIESPLSHQKTGCPVGQPVF